MLLCPILIISIWVSEGLVKCELLFHLLCLPTRFQCCSGQHSFISCRRSGFNSPFRPTQFQLSFFSFSSFWGRQNFLLKASNLRNQPSSEGRVMIGKRASIKTYLLLQGLRSNLRCLF